MKPLLDCNQECDQVTLLVNILLKTITFNQQVLSYRQTRCTGTILGSGTRYAYILGKWAGLELV